MRSVVLSAPVVWLLAYPAIETMICLETDVSMPCHDPVECKPNWYLCNM